jgi:hypothetical protein
VRAFEGFGAADVAVLVGGDVEDPVAGFGEDFVSVRGCPGVVGLLEVGDVVVGHQAASLRASRSWAPMNSV